MTSASDYSWMDLFISLYGLLVPNAGNAMSTEAFAFSLLMI